MSSSIDWSGLFSSSTSSSTESAYGVYGGIYSNLSQSALNKSGVALKVAKKYVSVQNGTDADSVAENKKKENKKLALAKSAAEELTESLSGLVSGKVFTKKTTKDEDGNETTDYDKEEIVKAVKSFAEKYNNLITKGSEPDTVSVLRLEKHMTSLVEKHSKLLSSVGITIGEGNKLSVDEDKLKEANVSTLKAIFTSSGSLGDQVENYASSIARVSNAAMKSGSTYSSSGTYAASTDSSTGTMLDTLIGDDNP